MTLHLDYSICAMLCVAIIVWLGLRYGRRIVVRFDWRSIDVDAMAKRNPSLGIAQESTPPKGKNWVASHFSADR
jgi:hypothetical protein